MGVLLLFKRSTHTQAGVDQSRSSPPPAQPKVESGPLCGSTKTEYDNTRPFSIWDNSSLLYKNEVLFGFPGMFRFFFFPFSLPWGHIYALVSHASLSHLAYCVPVALVPSPIGGWLTEPHLLGKVETLVGAADRQIEKCAALEAESKSTRSALAIAQQEICLLKAKLPTKDVERPAAVVVAKEKQMDTFPCGGKPVSVFFMS